LQFRKEKEMVSDIKIFKVDAKWTRHQIVSFGEGEEGVWNWKEVKKETLKQFDKWLEEKKPKILSVNFGRIHGAYIEDSPHYFYIEVLYLTDEEQSDG